MPSFPRSACREIARSCILFGVRSASRAITQLYEEALAPAGLRATQLSILVAAAVRGDWTMTALAQALGMDRTTLTRNAAPLRRKGLLQIGPGRDDRTHSVRLTDQGHAVLHRAYPLWKETQARIRREMGPSRARSLVRGLRQLASIVRS
jgi:DNA-binding MarR family transcriptional regulator